MTDISKLTDEELLGLRFRDLRLSIEGTSLEKHVNQLYAELTEKNIRFHPACFLADEWLCPDEEPVIGIAFYLAHPRLKSLENKMMLEVEGGDKQWCMKLLRHEAGHAINYAYVLHRRKKWKDLFGHFAEEYPDTYKYRPYSKRFVRHLDGWYAQYHPDEDFAETLAVWLNPKSNWQKKYKGWKALDKLKYVDKLMKEIGPKLPKKNIGKKHWDVSRMKTTLRTHYRKRKEFYAEHYPDFHDFHLKNIFENKSSFAKNSASKVIGQNQKSILDYVAFCTGEKKYIINDLLKDLSSRCRELDLYANSQASELLMKLTAYVTSLTMNYLYTGTFKDRKRQGSK